MPNSLHTDRAEAQSWPGYQPASPKSKGAPRMGRASKLRLLARLHGEGLVTWSGTPVSVVYDLDVFGGGALRTVSGFVDGDFGAAHESGQDETGRPTPMAAHLRLENGSEVAIQIVVVAPDVAEIEAPLTSAEVDLLSTRN